MKNKHLLAVMALTLCCAFAATAYANWSLPLWADINNDGDVNVADALGVVAVILELDNAPTPEAVGVEVVVEACPVDQYRATPDGDCQAVVAPTTCTAPALLNTTTNACVTPTTCTSPALLNTATNVCVTPEAARWG